MAGHKKITKTTVWLLLAIFFFLAFAATLTTTLYFALPRTVEPVKADNRNFKDAYPDYQGYVFEDSEFRAKMYFRVFLPENYDENTAYPLLIFLHGNGSQGTNNTAQMKPYFLDAYAEVRNEYPAIVFVPQFPKGYGGSRDETNWKDGMYTFMACLKEGVLNRYSVDRTRIYLTGMSMGGFETIRYAKHFPELFAAIVPLCGGEQDDYGLAKNLKDIPTWIVHSRDDDIVPFSFSQHLYDALAACGASDLTFTVYDDRKHNVSGFYAEHTNNTANKDLWAWMFAQQKSA